MKIGHFRARLTDVAVGGEHIALWRVADLERHVDRAALLGAEDAPEPPYWAHLWSRALARLVAPTGHALVADAGRIDTRAFYPALEAAGLAWRARELTVREEGLPVVVRVVEIAHALPRAAPEV